ncbi:MAG: acyl carrier protein [Cyanobacteria bacterium P01_D01_bin.116]
MNSILIDEKEPQEKEYYGILERWAEISTSERQEILGAYICSIIATAIGISPSEVNMQQSIQYLGIDSLIAVKLRNKVRKDWLVDLAAVKFLDDLTVSGLVILMDEQIENFQEQNDENWLEGEI